ncbi:MAG TPA: hypothetical protein VKQ28_16870 [Candidatus Acidoferrum sp.]|nr:hypothetical protein [Candidatus Acidoferrum sp.]
MFKSRDLGVKMMTSANLASSSPTLSPITVSTVQIEDANVVYEITAALGEHKEVQRHTVGVGGTNPHQAQPMSASDLQAALDGFRQHVADTVAWRAIMEESSAQVS